MDRTGNVYVADTINNRIQKFSTAGTFLDAWNTFLPGNLLPHRPTGLAVDRSRNLYVADTNNR